MEERGSVVNLEYTISLHSSPPTSLTKGSKFLTGINYVFYLLAFTDCLGNYYLTVPFSLLLENRSSITYAIPKIRMEY
ncbi:hypothetical protein JOC54_000086 [Alkalihalobacillus xiaoxiensis]|uniref:Uncharacterized protein n=1 Tax=Shouchella xiaoxiensis TaxID=766895 RepID=A0ABS2SNP7_9BACI|nr:hypothetical protein [Shouchella xiaoxiensis]